MIIIAVGVVIFCRCSHSFKVKQMTYTGISGILSDMKAEFLRTLREKQTQLCGREDLRGVYTVS